MTREKASKRIYRVIFHSQGDVYELHARHLGQSDMYGFVEIRDLIFGERSAVLVDPADERLKSEFAGVKRAFIPMHAVVRIDEVEHEGKNRITQGGAGGAKVTPFPNQAFAPGRDPK